MNFAQLSDLHVTTGPLGAEPALRARDALLLHRLAGDGTILTHHIPVSASGPPLGRVETAPTG